MDSWKHVAFLLIGASVGAGVTTLACLMALQEFGAVATKQVAKVALPRNRAPSAWMLATPLPRTIQLNVLLEPLPGVGAEAPSDIGGLSSIGRRFSRRSDAVPVASDAPPAALVITELTIGATAGYPTMMVAGLVGASRQDNSLSTHLVDYGPGFANPQGVNE